MARYSLYVLKVPLNAKQTNKQKYVCYRFTRLPSGLCPHVTHILNVHDLENASVHNNLH